MSSRGLASRWSDGNSNDAIENSILRIDRQTLAVTRIDVGGTSREIAVSPDGKFAYAVLTSRPAVAVVDLTTNQLVNLGAALGLTESGITLPTGVPRSVVFFTLSASDAATLGLVGTFAYILGSDGFAYLVGLPGCQPTTACEPAHFLADSNPAGPSVTFPILRLGGTTQPVTERSPKIVGYDLGGNYGIEILGGRGIVLTEQWSLTFEGRIPNTAPGPATVVGADRLENVAVDFPARGVLDGDHILILDAPLASTDPACAAALSAAPAGCDALQAEFPVSLVPGAPARLQVQIPAGKSLACCYPGRLAYELRTPGVWAVNGSVSGLQGRARTNERFTNKVFGFTIASPVSPDPDAQRIPRDLSWDFTVLDAVAPVRIAVGDTPERAVPSRTDKTMLFSDSSGEQVLHVSPAQNGVLRILR